MEVSRELEILCAEPESDDYERGWIKTAELRAAVHEGIRLAARQRLNLARQFLEAAQRMLHDSPSEVDLRNSISRAYYACHHAARACCLDRGDGDQRGHTEAINGFGLIVQREPYLRSLLSARSQPVVVELLALLDARHLADYSPYGVVDCWHPEPEDFRELARGAVELAEQVVLAVEKFARQRRQPQ